MGSFQSDLAELQRRLGEGAIQRAYQAIIYTMSRLRLEFVRQRGEGTVAGLYQGYFDMTYFAIMPEELKRRELKLAIVFNYATFRFEVWLAARNRPVQRRYWALLRDAGYDQHPLVEPAAGRDAIVEAVLAEEYSLDDAEGLSAVIIEGVSVFERDMVEFLNRVEAG